MMKKMIHLDFQYSLSESVLNELGDVCMQLNSPAHEVVPDALLHDAFEPFEGHTAIARHMELMACDISQYGPHVKVDFDIDPDVEKNNVKLIVSMTDETLRKSLG